MKMSEDELKKGVIQGAEWTGWRAYHVLRVDKTLPKYNTTAPGFPDVFLVHPERMQICIPELKNNVRYPTKTQREWAQAIAMAARIAPENVHHCLWRPRHYDDILRYLQGALLLPPNRTEPKGVIIP